MLQSYGFQNWIAGQTPRKLVYVDLEVQCVVKHLKLRGNLEVLGLNHPIFTS